ncbi:lipopolysaccharide biosynthesis protein [Mediterraneibacter glycyrrhizinilyticus]|uniref:lipopolysaccharide biosynthesis protein n=1 Tax=Mediterraneibacter glycyrrhizinilyticus TaxID=342942 RepID=UPI0025A43A5C|nr:oligosaccharide flippase family protein [Mediterraneibacter glycyrrhizinilyticus]MDM8209872.1 oligosaccharide flippase family protein [Mediterraneibacter glycyrrhizinilyticus]
MEAYKRLLGNIGFLTLSNFATKILSFLLLPLYTRVLTTDEYGLFDLISTAVSLFVPILTLSVHEGILRYALEKNSKHKDIFSVGVKYFFISNIILCAALFVNRFFNISDLFVEYSFIFFLLFNLYSANGIVSYFVRGLGDIRRLSIGSCLSAFITLVLNILFLTVFKLGLTGYFSATIIGQAAPIIYYFVCYKLWKYVSFKKSEMEKDIVRYSIPMIANSVSWWINGAADRFFVSFFCGLGVNGIYSVAHKIPSIMSIFQNIFTQAWSVSAVQDFDKDDKTGFYANTYETYNSFLVIICSFIICCSKVIASVLYAKSFYMAWEVAPFLIISTLFSGMSGYLGGILSALKKTDTFAKTSIITAIINVILNAGLVPLLGGVGASVATAVAFFAMWILRLRTVCKYIPLRIDEKKTFLAYVLISCQAVLMLIFNRNSKISIIQLLIFSFIVILYHKLYLEIIRKLWKFILGRRS